VLPAVHASDHPAQFVSQLAGLLRLSGGHIAAYPMCQLAAAAAWQLLELDTWPAAAQIPTSRRRIGQLHPGWRRVRESVLEAGSDSSLDVMLSSLLGPDVVLATRGGGRVMDLAAPVFQDLQI
jgi:hypothetical protein